MSHLSPTVVNVFIARTSKTVEGVKPPVKLPLTRLHAWLTAGGPHGTEKNVNLDLIKLQIVSAVEGAFGQSETA
jgi:hypothetical protein